MVSNTNIYMSNNAFFFLIKKYIYIYIYIWFVSSHGSIVICHSSFMILVSISIKYWLLSLILLLQVVYRHSWDYRFQVFELTKLSIEDIQLIGLSMWLSHIYCVDWIPVSKIVRHTFNFELVLICKIFQKMNANSELS